MRAGDGAATARQQRLAGVGRCGTLAPLGSRPLVQWSSASSVRWRSSTRAARSRSVAASSARCLAVLLLHANETLSTDRLIDELWGETPPATAAKTVQVHVSRLRKALPATRDDLIVTREHGYQLRIDRRADRRAALRAPGRRRRDRAGGGPPGRGRRARSRRRSPSGAARRSPTSPTSRSPSARSARLGDLRAGALEQRSRRSSRSAATPRSSAQLETLIAEHPYRERLRAQLMLALYRCERQADALQAYQDARATARRGARHRAGRAAARARARDPRAGPGARAAGRSQPAPVVAPPAPAPEPLPARAARRLVSIVFADLAGSTGLGGAARPRVDARPARPLHGGLRGGDRAARRHVEGFIGDAVVGVFGLSRAARGRRAASRARGGRDARGGAALSAELERERGVEIGVKFGVEAGEVFLGAGARRSPFAAGDAFNVAARLEGSHPRARSCSARTSIRSSRDAVRAEPLEPSR